MLTIVTAFCLLLGMAASAPAYTFTPGLYVGNNFYSFNLVSPNKYVATSDDQSFSASISFHHSDPTFIWSLSATNNLNADVAVAMISPLFATLGYENYITEHSSAGVSLTDNGSGSAYVKVNPLFGFETTIDTNVTLDSAFNVVNFWGALSSFIPAIGANETAVKAQSFNGIGPNFPNDWFLEIVSFNLSANDSTGLSGTCSFVPLPPSVLLLGSGILGLGLLGRRKRKEDA